MDDYAGPGVTSFGLPQEPRVPPEPGAVSVALRKIGWTEGDFTELRRALDAIRAAASDSDDPGSYKGWPSYWTAVSSDLLRVIDLLRQQGAQRDRLRAALRGLLDVQGDLRSEADAMFRDAAIAEAWEALSDPTPSPVEHGWETRHRVHPAQTDWVVLPQKSEAECLHWIDAWDDGGVVTEAEAVRVERTVVHHWKRTPEAPDGN